MAEFTQFIIGGGIPEETVVLILMLPIVATFISAAREIIGIKGFGVYSSLITGYAFVATGLLYGVVILLLVLISGSFIRYIIKRIRILHLPRMAIILTGVAFTIFLLFFEAVFSNRTDFIKQAPSLIFPIIIMIALIENFIAAQIEQSGRSAITLTAETAGLAMVSYFIIGFEPLRNLVLGWPFVMFGLIIVLNIILGRWTGLRIVEYIRFRDLIKHMETPIKKH